MYNLKHVSFTDFITRSQLSSFASKMYCLNNPVAKISINTIALETNINYCIICYNLNNIQVLSIRVVLYGFLLK